MFVSHNNVHLINYLNPIFDQHHISPGNIIAYLTPEVTRRG